MEVRIMTKIELEQINTQLARENQALRMRCSAYITQLEAIKALQAEYPRQQLMNRTAHNNLKEYNNGRT
jgi:hypothetical protein